MTSRRDVVKRGAAAAAGAAVAVHYRNARPAFAVAPKQRAGLLAFRSTAGKIGVETLWQEEGGQWDWNVSMPFAADVGDRKNQPCFLYGYPDSSTALFAFDKALKPERLWESGPGNWSLDRSLVTVADVHQTGRNEIYVLYGYPRGVTGLISFGNSLKPQKLWETGPGGWNWETSRFFSADIYGTGKIEPCAFYQYGNAETGLIVDLMLENKPYKLFVMSQRFSGIGKFTPGNPKIVTADVHGAGGREVCAWYEHPDDRASLIVFDNLFNPKKVWESGPGQWPCGRTQVAVADIHGKGRSELCLLVRDDEANTMLFVFDKAFKPQKIWESDSNRLDWNHSKFFAAATPNNPRSLCALYRY